MSAATGLFCTKGANHEIGVPRNCVVDAEQMALSEGAQPRVPSCREWSCATKELGSGSDQGAGTAAGSGLWRGLFHYVAEAYEQFAKLAAFFEFHVHDFEGAGLSIGIADDG
jgi:hypothetical protein